jgi:non-ribosomal peptide synthetase component F
MTGMKAEFEDIKKLSMEALDVSTLPGLQAHVPRLSPSVDLAREDAISASRFHLWFEGQASKRPDSLALHSAEKELAITYGELNDEANRIAHCSYS